MAWVNNNKRNARFNPNRRDDRLLDAEAAEGKLKAAALYEVLKQKKFVPSEASHCSKLRAMLTANLHLFSGKQKKVLEEAAQTWGEKTEKKPKAKEEKASRKKKRSSSSSSSSSTSSSSATKGKEEKAKRKSTSRKKRSRSRKGKR
ncbi:unnamed protein product [Durusdinium trenchii]|uniref:Uncharacterized protein n=1 Tax=Durusdinium trenchii TaxID=1381693 RepID=A0ABP0IVN8_9DINO